MEIHSISPIAGLSSADSNFIVGSATGWVTESGATVRTSLGLGTGDSPQFTALNIGTTFDIYESSGDPYIAGVDHDVYIVGEQGEEDDARRAGEDDYRDDGLREQKALPSHNASNPTIRSVRVENIAQTVLADFIFLGRNGKGSEALGRDRRGLFTTAIDSYAQAIEDTINKHAIPRLLGLNGYTLDVLPTLKHGEVVKEGRPID